jgi:hypothetical protein
MREVISLAEDMAPLDAIPTLIWEPCVYNISINEYWICLWDLGPDLLFLNTAHNFPICQSPKRNTDMVRCHMTGTPPEKCLSMQDTIPRREEQNLREGHYYSDESETIVTHRNEGAALF